MEPVQMNVRIDASLKEAGDETLEKLGWSLTQTIRYVWRYLAAHRDDPQTIVRTLCDEPVNEAERAKLEERARKATLAKQGLALFSQGCASLGLDSTAFAQSQSEEGLLAGALMDRLDEEGLA